MRFIDMEIMRKINWKMHKDYSPVILAVGPPGVGKTMLSAKIAEILHPLYNQGKQWDCKKYTVFDMNDFSHKFLTAFKKIFVIAEAGYDLSFDEWFNKTNRFFDKVITTQRVMGNCYILNIPVGKDLARRHRRKVNYILKVTGHGRFQAIINRIKSEVMTGDEFKPFKLERYYGIGLPKCYEELKELDTKNKELIREKIVEEYQEDQKKLEIIKTRSRPIYKAIICGKCGETNTPKSANPRACPRCGGRYKWPKEHKSKLQQSNPNLVELRT